MSNLDLAQSGALGDSRLAGRRGAAEVWTVANELPTFFAVVAAIGLAVYLLSNQFFYLNLLTMALLFGGLAVSWNIIGGFGGQFSIAHSVFFAIGAYTAGNLYKHFGVSPWIAILPAMLLSAAVAAIVSWPVFRLRGPFFAIATMALTEVAIAFAMHWKAVTGGASGLTIPYRAGLENMIFQQRWAYAALFLGYLAVTLLTSIVILRSRLGYYLQAVRDNDKAAEASGIPIMWTKLKGMAISAALTGIGGVFFMMYVRIVEPAGLLSLFDVGVKIALIALIGGIGTIYGPLLGALILVPLDYWLRAFMGSAVPGGNLIVLGLILVLGSLFMKKGVAGALRQVYRAWSRQQ
ncbi:MAG: branched-chain amino acid ABC transporter permease [Rhizobiales bacterium]|nr:branched-chain amino acid ABC transporter permease [Hyphomicrobiales bacterium]